MNVRPYGFSIDLAVRTNFVMSFAVVPGYQYIVKSASSLVGSHVWADVKAVVSTPTRIANGNTIICSRGGNGKGPQLVEVTRDKKVVWVLQDWEHLVPPF